MPSSDYTNAVGGGLKLKGAKDAGIKKHRKKKPKPVVNESKTIEGAEETGLDGDSGALQKALAEEEEEQGDELKSLERKEVKGDGKTDAQRRREEMRRKRVRESLPLREIQGIVY